MTSTNSGARRIAARQKFLAGMNYGSAEQLAAEAFDAGWSAHQHDHRGNRLAQRQRRVANGKARPWVKPTTGVTTFIGGTDERQR